MFWLRLITLKVKAQKSRFISVLIHLCTPALLFCCEYKATKWIAILGAKWVGRGLSRAVQKTVNTGTVRDMQEVGKILQASNDSQLKKAGLALEHDAERYILFRIFHR